MYYLYNENKGADEVMKNEKKILKLKHCGSKEYPQSMF